VVRDHREVVIDGSALCHPCAHGGYYENAKETTWPNMNWTPVSSEQTAAGSGQQDECSWEYEERNEAATRGRVDAARRD
jgi:hypothetical protein